jgi:SAM-dependent methyltransferase
MMNWASHENPGFDEYATDYDAALEKGISVSGEQRDYFARGRIDWLAKRLREIGEQPSLAMDFGCGTGEAARFLFNLVGVTSLYGVDTSPKSLEIARRNCNGLAAQFALLSEYKPAGHLDVAYCNGVFHHIPPGERAAAVDYIYRSLRPGGLLALWENNPLNPGTRYVMSRIPFDRDAITLKHTEARLILDTGGFEVLRTDFLFIFPRALRWLRRVEPHVARWPIGAQYQVLCRRRQC